KAASRPGLLLHVAHGALGDRHRCRPPLAYLMLTTPRAYTRGSPALSGCARSGVAHPDRTTSPRAYTRATCRHACSPVCEPFSLRTSLRVVGASVRWRGSRGLGATVSPVLNTTKSCSHDVPRRCFSSLIADDSSRRSGQAALRRRSAALLT